MSAEAPDRTIESLPRYDLTPEEIARLSQEFLDEVIMKDQKASVSYEQGNGLLDGPLSCHIIRGGGPYAKYANLGRSVERMVFESRYNNTPQQMEAEYQDYEGNNIDWLVVFHHTSKEGIASRTLTGIEPVGVMRVIRPSDKELKTLKDLEALGAKSSDGQLITPELVYQHYGTSPDKCIDIATLAVLDGFRSQVGHTTSLLLFRGFYLEYLNSPDFTRPEIYSHVVTILDLEAKKNIDAMGMPLDQLLGTGDIPYLDNRQEGPTTLSRPLIAPTDAFHPAVTGRAEKLAQEIKELRAFVEYIKIVPPEEFYGTDISASDEARKAKQRIVKKGTLVMGMKLLENGCFKRHVIEPDGKIREIEINIDNMLATELTRNWGR